MSQIPTSSGGAPTSMTPAPYPTRAKTSGWAIASLVLGILFCVPVIASVLAAIFGVVGIRQTKNPQVGGRGMAVAGLVLGLLGVIFWLIIGGSVGWLYSASTQPRALARQLAQDLSNADASAAASRCTSDIPGSRIETAIAQLKSYGALQDVTMSHISANSNTPGVTHWDLNGVATFANRTVPYKASVYQSGDTYLISDFQFIDLRR